MDVWAPPRQDARRDGGAGGEPQSRAPGAAPQAAQTTPGGAQSGTIDRIAGEPGEAIGRGAGEGQEDREARRDPPASPGSPGSGAGAGATPTPTPAANLTVTTTLTSGYDQPNTLTVSPFGEMIPSFEFTNIAWTISGDTCNVTARLACHYPWGINGGSCTDVPSGNDAVVTSATHASSGRKVWETIADDLTPNAASPFKSPRNYYWSSALTGRHERYHGTDDYAWVTSTGQPDALAFIQSRTVSRANTSTDVRGVLEQARRRVAQGSDAYYGVSLAHDARPGEIRAYSEGRPAYQALADAVRVRGRALDAAAPGGGSGGSGGTAPGGPAPGGPAPGGTGGSGGASPTP